ncbi:MAG: tRNA/rRNA methyltransferase [Chlamydiae bacterium]|nr:tRNA/rRNA methyltransferase [Chlamydiota bacterium]
MKTRKEIKYYGLHSSLELFNRRPDDIIRVYVEESKLKNISHILKWCAQNKKAYHIVSDDELNKITESVHHEGICILAKEKDPISLETMLNNISSKPIVNLLYLDGVQNPHNIGSIMRICAHFGVNYILGDENKLPNMCGASCRIAIGAAEMVSLVALKDPIFAIKKLKENKFSIIATSSHKGASLYKHKFSKKNLFVLGSESSGISPQILKQQDTLLQIPGTQEVESLNVSVATALFLAEGYRQLYERN